jgi:ABC-type multidrug transport system ATPase subunit
VTVVGVEQSGPAPILVARGLGRKYEGFIALGSFAAEVMPGELIALVGPNGAGKTTFLTIAAGLLEPSSGRLEVNGAAAGSIDARRAVSYLPDTPVFYDDLSLDEHLEYVGGLHGVADDGTRARRLLERLGLENWGDSLPSEFSHGMRQKASIALALVRPFSILLADEPFDGLDPPSRDATHRHDVVGAANRCLALRDGRLAYDGPPDDESLAEFFTGEERPDPGPGPEA